MPVVLSDDFGFEQADADILAEHERDKREAKRFDLNRCQAKFPADKRLEGFEYRYQTQSTISKRQVNALLDFVFLDNRENLVFIDPPDVGKTHLAIGINQKTTTVT